MNMDVSMLFIIIGGLLEPVWVICLKKFNEKRNPVWFIITAFFCILSPAMMGLGLDTVSVGVAYAVWTGIGSVCTVIVGYFLYKDKISAMKMACIGLILAGVVGLELVSGGSS